MRRVLVSVSLLGVVVAGATGCGGTTSTSTSGRALSLAGKAESAGMLSPYWRKHHTDGWIGDTMKAVCTDLRKNDSRPQLEALALTKLKGVSVTDAESLVAAGIVTQCPAAAKVPKAWR